ncbi:MAG TPA: GNAT family N-acetyltransferase [Sphingomicrobium sp.]|nr:GNAT family N-acetyltransferase [Sphingomicrobium sp.]
MADREQQVIARIAPGVAALDAGQWDDLAGTADPFLSHAFLAALEVSGSVGEGTGWTPAPIIVEGDAGRISTAAPAYLKTHSQGEYVFDHGWAEAFEQAGGHYYPKLQIAVPFTPVPGRRLLGPSRQALLAAIEAAVAQNHLSSAHATFIDESEFDDFAGRGWLIRSGIQFHWLNRGYASFDEFLGHLASRKRKQIRKERTTAVAGLEVRALRGAEIGAPEWQALWTFYQHTGARKWGRPYLTREFFDRLGAALGHRCLLFMAYREGRAIGGALNLIGGDTLYGRYWGAIEDVPFLHFELSYYRAIEWAIDQRLASVQAGAQGEHKLARGYEPVLTRSAHFLPDPSFRRAVADFLAREDEMIAAELAWCREALPYRSSASE